MLPGDGLAVQLAGSDELVYSALGGGVEVPHDHAQGVVVALAHNVIHDVQQGTQLSNLHATRALSIACMRVRLYAVSNGATVQEAQLETPMCIKHSSSTEL